MNHRSLGVTLSILFAGLIVAQAQVAPSPVRIMNQAGTVGVNPTTSGSLPVISTGGTTFGTARQSVTASAVALGTNAAKSVTVRVLFGGASDPIYIGTTGVTTSTGFPLYAGDAVTLAVANTNQVFVIAAGTGSSVAYLWSN
jgi:hypothetical protein